MNEENSEERMSESIFEDAPEPENSPNDENPPRRSWWKGAVVVALVLAVVVIMAVKQSESNQQQVRSGEVGGTDEIADDEGAGKSFPSDTVLASVNGDDITLAELESALNELPQQHRSAFKNNRHGLLDQLISRELLVQKARQVKPAQNEDEDADDEEGSASEAHPKTDDERINGLLQREVIEDIEVTDDDIQAFYEEHKDQMPAGRDFDELKPSLRQYARHEKMNEEINAYLAELKEAAEITRNQEWIEAQKARAANNPLDRALDKNMPVLADFGQNSCVPCKMMKPILDDLKENYKGRAEILIIQTNEYPAITQRVGVRAIPTQIFYDAEGNEVDRHQGYMSREAITKQLKEMGVE